MVQQKSAIKSDDIDCMQKSYHFLRSYFCMFIRSNWVQQDDRISSIGTILLNNRLQWVLRVHHAFNLSNYEAKWKVSLSLKKDQSETLPHYFVKWRGPVKFLLDSAQRGRKALSFTRYVKCFAPRNHSSESERTAEGTRRLNFIVFVILSSDPSLGRAYLSPLCYLCVV